MKRRLFLCAVGCAAFVLLPLEAKAREKVEATMGLDLVSNYIWRGQDFGGAAFQPTLAVAYKGLSLTCFGSYGFVDRDDTKEVDFTLAYAWKGLTVGLTDYYCTAGREGCPGNYFLYKNNHTRHVFEAGLGYDFDFLSINWYTNVAGADGVNKSGKRAYTSYVEVAAPFKLAKLDWVATVGVVPYASSFYAKADDFAVTRVSLKAGYDIPLGKKFTLPLSATVTANPSAKKMYFTAGVSFTIDNNR